MKTTLVVLMWGSVGMGSLVLLSDGDELGGVKALIFYGIAAVLLAGVAATDAVDRAARDARERHAELLAALARPPGPS